MKLAPAFVLLCLPLLMACQVGNPLPGPARPKGAPPVGGAAGQMGPLYCQTVPADKSARWQWSDLCFPNNP